MSDRPENAARDAAATPAPAGDDARTVRSRPRDPEHPGRESGAFVTLRSAAEPDVWDTLARWHGEGRRIALLTVTETNGMTPRKQGARMLLAEDGETSGTVGGGALEQAALEGAREMFATGEMQRTLHWHLTQELGMCCGGEMTIRIERVEAAPALVVFGAGYIGRSLALLALGCGFRVTVVDDRLDWADPARLPGVRVVCRDVEEFVRATPPGPRDYAVVVTHEHALDQRLIEHLLHAPPRFLGMIGSLAKQRKFALRLRAKGFDDEAIARLRSPLGLAIGASTPEEIAVSVMAELVAARRGVEVGPAGAPPLRHEGSRRAPRAGAEATASQAAAAASQEVETP